MSIHSALAGSLAVLGANRVQDYFKVMTECATASKLRNNAK
jgi:hypothetical protein